MRTFTFTIVRRTSASGYSRVTEGSKWLRLAQKLYKKGKIKVHEGELVFTGYGSSYDIGYTSREITVTEIV
jgi:hypothetical protein